MALQPVKNFVPAVLAVLLTACAGDISLPGNDDSAGGGGGVSLPGPGGAQAAFTRSAAGYDQGRIDATGSDWVYLNLDTQTQVQPATPEASAEWDLAFRGAEIKLNGGVSGTPPGGQAVVIYPDKTAEGTPYPFDEVVGAPPPNVVEYVTDEAGALPVLPARLAMNQHPAADESPMPVTGTGDHGWYRNDGSQISARSNAGYIVRTVECRYYKLRMTGYSHGGVQGHPQFDVQEIPGVECSNASGGIAPLGRASFTPGSASTVVQLDAADEEDWVYLDLAGARQSVPTTPENDAGGWDIAWRRTDIKLNGGASGAGDRELHARLRDDWAARSSVPAGADWHTDTAEALAFVTYPPREIGGECAFAADGDYGWYYYSGFCDKGNGNHYISPRDAVYLLRGRSGQVWKLRVLAYYDSAGTAAQPRFEYAPLSP